MKKLFLFLFLNLLAFSSEAQSLFFEQMQSSEWTSNVFLSDSAIADAKEIGLGRLRGPLDSLKTNRTVWTFGDVLTLSNYNAMRGTRKVLAVYLYEVDKKKGLLIIRLSPGEVLSFDVGIISTGSFALLVRKKNKPR